MYSHLVTDVFFDLDHTLWDFDKNSSLTFQKILLQNNVEVDIEDFLDIYVPLNLRFWKLYREEKISKQDLRYQRLKKTFVALKYTVSDAMIDLLAEQYIANLSTFNHLLPNALETLDYLKPNYNLHIITNGFQEIQEKKMKNAKIHGYFDQIIDSEMAGVKKPNPIIFKLALKRAAVEAQRSMMIGDNIEADILGAMAVGFHSIHFNAHNDPKHDHCKIIHDLSEIKSFL
ncbi:YjjG family noncanonical pyrimidine nucleotidase [Spongiimicrobium sp. 3-5]|uniref:YjjG family noncanonical pyrimidine nucleotidase n=1 Tax=Spongiimicrobium sp. 3-5 TaxID=3332596 RepID=UPI00397F6AA6